MFKYKHMRISQMKLAKAKIYRKKSTISFLLKKKNVSNSRIQQPKPKKAKSLMALDGGHVSPSRARSFPQNLSSNFWVL